MNNELRAKSQEFIELGEKIAQGKPLPEIMAHIKALQEVIDDCEARIEGETGPPVHAKSWRYS